MSTLRARVIIAALWLLSLAAVGTIVHAQQNRPPTPAPTLFSGADIGFQATETDGKSVIGKLVVRVNGEWKDVQFAPGPRVQPLIAR